MKNLFIIGIFRSGTSLLSTALNTHKNIIVGWQPYMLFFKACRNKYFKEMLRVPFDEKNPMGINYFKTVKDRELFREVFHLIRFNATELSTILSEIRDYLLSDNEKMNKDMKPHDLAKNLDGIEPGFAGYILMQLMERLYLSQIITRNWDIKFIGIKEVFCEEFIEPLFNYCNLNSKVVHIIRDPRAVVASRNFGKYMEATGAKYPIFFIIRSWKRTVANYLLNKCNSNYLMIRYEDLVRKPETTMKKVCELLEVQYSNDLLNLSNFKDNKGRRWESNTSFDGSKTITTSSVNKWEDILSAEEIEVVEYYCQSELNTLGYERTTKSFDQKKILNFQEDTSNICEWLREYDFSF
ncbi:MAG: sulfotransferase [Candidatus Kuenenia stuttgartiensis]|uniref:Sulfotransferase domain protein n=1 Tax=Kuenenia stuttgartiensis TaxID=174633 RepID=A0A2C9CEZ5_KUEST|nr:sulfotransferase [Candidatus Kuenenia stuttgartiensis]MBZ0192650.1 sulfotransferase [Candidatus Kuenenia stuttgartiensis]SOH04469.1 Sulfotransferase domain protein [Candidatus Kuenenia stuttgartiensis]